MLILDPKSGRSVAVDLSFARLPFSAEAGPQGPRKDPAQSNKFLDEQVITDLRIKCKTTRHSWIKSHSEHNKNYSTFRIHSHCLHRAWSRPWYDAAQKP